MSNVLVQLPNKDLWKGFDPDRKRSDNLELTPTPTDAAKVEGNECMWCAMKFESTSLLKDHVEHLHFQQTHRKEVMKEYFETGQMPGAPSLETLGAEIKDKK